MAKRCIFSKQIFILTAMLLVSHVAAAQIQAISTHYMFNPQLINPAFYGSRDGINFGANYRHQWAKLEGQPQTISIFADAYLPQAHGAVGFSIVNDRLGAYSNNAIQAGYTFIQNIQDKVKIGIGLNAGITLSKLDGTKLVTPQGTPDGLNDDFLSDQVQRSIRPNLSLGVSVVHKWIEAGVVYTNVINAKDKFEGENQELQPKYGSVFQTYVGGKIPAGKNFSVRPALAFMTDFRVFQTDISFMAGYKEYAFIGLNVRGYNKLSFESLSPIVSVSPVKNLSVQYSYDVNLNKLSRVSNGSHEITLNYLLPNKKIYKNPKIINNPRFL
jgi:type IX secretion system PorP/SprF family membrane protein